MTYAFQFTDGRARTNLQSWRDGLGIAADLHVLAPWKLVKAEIRGIAGVIAKRSRDYRKEFKTATLEKMCCENLGPDEAPRDVLVGLEMLTQLAQRGGLSINKRDQSFLEHLVTALPESIQGKCANVHSADGALEYTSIVNVLRSEGPKLEALWKAKLEAKGNPPPAVGLQVAAVEDLDPADEPAPGPKRQKSMTAHPVLSVSQASITQPVQSPTPPTHISPYMTAPTIYTQAVMTQSTHPTTQPQYQYPLAALTHHTPYQAYPAAGSGQQPGAQPPGISEQRQGAGSSWGYQPQG